MDSSNIMDIVGSKKMPPMEKLMYMDSAQIELCVLAAQFNLPPTTRIEKLKSLRQRIAHMDWAITKQRYDVGYLDWVCYCGADPTFVSEEFKDRTLQEVQTIRKKLYDEYQTMRQEELNERKLKELNERKLKETLKKLKKQLWRTIN